MTSRLDAIDRRILKELQSDGRMTNVELSQRVGISAPPCLRRVRALEEAGYITGYVALLSQEKHRSRAAGPFGGDLRICPPLSRTIIGFWRFPPAPPKSKSEGPT